MSFLPMIMCLFFYIMIHTTGDLVLGSARPTLLTTCCQGWLHSLSHLLYASNIFHTLFYRLFYCHFLLFFCTHFFPLFLLLLNPHFLLFFTLFSFHFSQEKIDSKLKGIPSRSNQQLATIENGNQQEGHPGIEVFLHNVYLRRSAWDLHKTTMLPQPGHPWQWQLWPLGNVEGGLVDIIKSRRQWVLHLDQHEGQLDTLLFRWRA